VRPRAHRVPRRQATRRTGLRRETKIRTGRFAEPCPPPVPPQSLPRRPGPRLHSAGSRLKRLAIADWIAPCSLLRRLPMLARHREQLEVQYVYAALDQAHDLRRRHELHRDARLRRKAGDALTRCDEEIMDAVVEAAGAGGVRAQGMDGA